MHLQKKHSIHFPLRKIFFFLSGIFCLCIFFFSFAYGDSAPLGSTSSSPSGSPGTTTPSTTTTSSPPSSTNPSSSSTSSSSSSSSSGGASTPPSSTQSTGQGLCSSSKISSEYDPTDINIVTPIGDENLFCRCVHSVIRITKAQKKACTNDGGIVIQKFIDAEDISTNTPATDIISLYLGKIFSILIGLGALLAVGAIVFGGIVVSTSGSGEQSSEGKEKIITGLVALGVILMAGVILHTINPLYFQW